MPAEVSNSPLNNAIKSFDAAEANLVKLEQLWKKIESLIPDGVCFGDDENHEEHCRAFNDILDALPSIDGWKPVTRPMDLAEIGSARLDALDICEFDYRVTLERAISEPGRELREYRSRLNRKRRQLIRTSLVDLIKEVDDRLELLRKEFASGADDDHIDCHAEFGRYVNAIDQIDALLGSSVARPNYWADIQGLLFVATKADLIRIRYRYWDESKRELEAGLYGEADPLPVGVEDLSSLVAEKPCGPVTTRLDWERLEPEDFERLIYNLITNEPGYENPQWLTRTNATDRGRDLSVTHVDTDSLCGTRRRRVIVQCRHQQHSININDVATLKEQMKLWEPPRVEMLIIATTGRFTTDAIERIERNNQADTALHIEMWPEVHMEQILAKRPDVIAEFKLR